MPTKPRRETLPQRGEVLAQAPRARSASVAGSVVPRMMASRMARPETRGQSVATNGCQLDVGIFQHLKGDGTRTPTRLMAPDPHLRRDSDFGHLKHRKA
jgi:hypothetical protein